MDTIGADRPFRRGSPPASRPADYESMRPSLPRIASDLQRSLYRSLVIGALRHVFTTCAVSWSAELQTG
jgi:hypothetical protein